ncbi:hypothetical protein EVA_10680 [gut metagenome]|uniref:Uncharacterized protein n=1 Tax=gut metagenome TaxID=749906 RepID=J9G2Z0_9ZZZZ
MRFRSSALRWEPLQAWLCLKGCRWRPSKSWYTALCW